ncbi:MAG TPA: bacteriohemerythrin [Bacteroidales bacterium]|nr:bacteriohemerythrin [Bacteroidales bacterium]
MAYFDWNDSMKLGISAIDDQHKKMVDMIDEFYTALKNGAGNESIQKLIKGMNDYTVFHFSYEEKLLKEKGYPVFDSHKEDHDRFIAKVKDFESRFNTGKLLLTIEVTSFLKDWWSNHIQKSDRAYVEHLANSK